MNFLDVIKKWLGEDEEEVFDMEEESEEEIQELTDDTTGRERLPQSSYNDLPEKSIFIYRAYRFEDVRNLKPVLKRNIPVVVDLSALDDIDDRRRFLDFAWGMSRAGGGRMKVLDRVDLMFALISPSELWYIAEEEANSYPEGEDEEVEEE